MLKYHLQLKVKSKIECPFFLMHRLFVKIKHLPIVYRKPTFGGVYTHFDSFLPSNYKFGTVTHFLIDSSEYAQVGLNYTMNYFV